MDGFNGVENLTLESCLVSNGCQSNCTNGTTPAPSTSSTPSKSGLTKGEIIGIAFGSVGGLIILVGVAFAWRKMQNGHELNVGQQHIELEVVKNQGSALRILEAPGGLSALQSLGVRPQIGNTASPLLLTDGGRFGSGSTGRVLDP